MLLLGQKECSSLALFVSTCGGILLGLFFNQRIICSLHVCHFLAALCSFLSSISCYLGKAVNFLPRSSVVSCCLSLQLIDLKLRRSIICCGFSLAAENFLLCSNFLSCCFSLTLLHSCIGNSHKFFLSGSRGSFHSSLLPVYFL